MDIINLLHQLYSEINNTYKKDYVRDENSFYQYVIEKKSFFLSLLNSLDEEELIKTLKVEDFFKGNLTKKRFSNFCDLIFKECIAILESYYKGDIGYAYKKLYALLKSRNKIGKYWGDEYINSFSFEFLKGEKCLYRMVDVKIGEELNDCWHIHYEKRSFASYSRYSLSGIPCLYLADSENTARSECGNVQEGKQRWVSCFRPRKEKTLFFDLRIPANDEFNRYNLIDLIITYPIRFLCSVKVQKTDGYYHEEYYFPQLLFHLFFMSDLTDLHSSYKGFVYSSTANIGGENYVLPALYKQRKPLLNGISPELEKLFEASKPAVYND